MKLEMWNVELKQESNTEPSQTLLFQNKLMKRDFFSFDWAKASLYYFCIYNILTQYTEFNCHFDIKFGSVWWIFLKIWTLN